MITKLFALFPISFLTIQLFFWPLGFIFPFLGGVQGRKGWLVSIELLLPYNYLWCRAWTSAQGPGERKKSRNEIVQGETCGSDMLTAKEPGKGWVDGQHVQRWAWMGRKFHWDTKRRAPKSPRLGFRNSLLCSPSFLPSVISPAPPFLLFSTPLSQGSWGSMTGCQWWRAYGKG